MNNPSFTLNQEQRISLFAEVVKRSDKLMRNFLTGSFAFGLFLAPFYDTWLIAIGVGGLSLIAYFMTKSLLPDSKLYQYVGASVLAVFMAQFIYQMHGLFEMHFYAFVACTLLISYSNWRLQIPLLLLIVIHHAVFAYLQFIGIKGVFFTQLPYMDITTFLFHTTFAGVIIFICGLWAFHSEKKIEEDGIRALQAEEALVRNLAWAKAIQKGDFDHSPDTQELDPLGKALSEMRNHLQASKAREEGEKFVNTGVSRITALLSELRAVEPEEMARKLLAEIAKHIGASQATFFLSRDDDNGVPYLHMVGGYAFTKRKSFTNRVAWGEGLIGQAALEGNPIAISNIPDDYLAIGSSLGHAAPSHVIAWPLKADHTLIGVMEFAMFGEPDETQQQLLEEIAPRIAAGMAILTAQRKTESLLAASEKLKSRLQESNLQLEAKAKELHASEADLKAQKERLVDANTELETQALELEDQKKALVLRNSEVEQARAALMLKAEELETASQYKSEFLANMSHELRTPLNSILILAKMLSENKNETLSDKEVEHTQVIHRAGTDLLTLINDILDLSKIESGKLDIIEEEVILEELQHNMEFLFKEVASQKEINFRIVHRDPLPESFESDRVRVEQILKNLLSNAFKFTPKGGEVKLEFFRAAADQAYRSPELKGAFHMMGISISDTGIGIPKHKHEEIFKAFSQADGSTNRKYGGTGLGLSICMQLSQLLGGEIQLESKVNEGSTFTFFVPIEGFRVQQPAPVDPQTGKMEAPFNPEGVTVLTVEDDPAQNDAIANLLDRNGMKCIQAFTGKEALEVLSGEEEVTCVLLDLGLPDIDGMDVLEAIKKDPRNQELPVVIYTAKDLSKAMQARIMKYTHSMVIKTSRSSQRLIDEIQRLLTEQRAGVQADPKVAENPKSRTESHLASSFDETSRKGILEGLRVLLVDDDMRNIFAISAILESYGMEIEIAHNGREALDCLKPEDPFNMILMDIMMPEMDGYEATERIRQMPEFAEIPILAITAKAMKTDREKCLAAGASEYMSKPIDPDLLINTLCEWAEKDQKANENPVS